MPFATNQWLKGEVVRARGHHPVSVRLSVGLECDEWSKKHRVVASIRAARGDGSIQALYLTKTSMSSLILKLAALSDTETQHQLSQLVTRSSAHKRGRRTR
jgi:hypothetical protein